MSEFDLIFAEAADDLLAVFGVSVTYTTSSDSLTFLADFNPQRELMGDEYQTSYFAKTFTFKAGLVTEPSPGDQIVLEGQTYIVERPVSEDRHFVEVIVR